jgi:hypothetical protein
MSSGIMQFSKWVKDISLTPASSSTRENQPYLKRKIEGLFTERNTSATATVSLVVHL